MKTINAIFIIGIVMRVAGIHIPPLWYDENFTLILARLPFDQMLAVTAGDVHPPLWYIVEWMWIRTFPDPMLAPVWTLRLPSLVFSVLALYVAHLVFFELNVPRKIHIGALALMAILPMQIWYAQEARMYALLELEVLLSLLFALRANYFRLFVTSLAMLYTQNYAVFYLACIGAWVLFGEIEFKKHMGSFSAVGVRLISAIGAACVLFLPWVSVIMRQMNYIGGRYWIQKQLTGDVLNVVYKLFFASSIPSFSVLSALMVVFMAIILGMVYMAKERHPAALPIIVMAFGPLLGAWLMSVIWHPILLYRALIGSSPLLYVIAAWSFGRLDRQWREALIASVMVLPVLIAGVGGYYQNIDAMKNAGAVSSLLDALDYVKAHWQPGDVIYYTDDGPAVNLLPYAGDLPQFGMAACGEQSYGLVLGSLNPSIRDIMGIVVRDFADLDGYSRVWVFAPRSPLHPVCYEEQIAPYTSGDPLIVVDDNDFIFSGVWLVEK